MEEQTCCSWQLEGDLPLQLKGDLPLLLCSLTAKSHLCILLSRFISQIGLVDPATQQAELFGQQGGEGAGGAVSMPAESREGKKES